MKRSWSIVALGCSFVAACADTTQLTRPSEQVGKKLDSARSVYIAVPKDGVYGDENYPGSGLTTAQTLSSAFAKRVRRVDVGNVYQAYDDALKTARDKAYTYLVYPTILHWEDRATEWSGRPDRIEVKIEVVEVTTDGLMDSAIIKGTSKWATLGGDHPQDLLPKPVEEFVASLY